MSKATKRTETLDSKHLELLQSIQSMRDGIPAYEELIHRLREEERVLVERMEESPLLRTDVFTDLEDKDYSELCSLRERIENLEKEVDKIQNGEYLNEYFMKTGYILYHYYNGALESSGMEEPSSHETIKRPGAKKVPVQTVVDSEEDTDSMDSEDTESVDRVAPLPKKKTKITDYIDKQDGFEKAEIYEKFIKIVNNETFVQKDIFDKRGTQDCGSVCPECVVDLQLIHNEGILVCPECGYCTEVLIDSEKPSFRDPPPEVSYFAYKRINHFNEWLSQFQAKESTEIPAEIYELIMVEMKKERITDVNKLTKKKIREYLKKLKLNKYYEHIPHIIYKLNNQKVPLISKDLEEKLRHMFREIQAPFMKVKNIRQKTRKNFLSYSYVLHKFVELLGLDELKESFPLLKSREKLHQQDQIWKDICKELNWMYIKSI